MAGSRRGRPSKAARARARAEARLRLHDEPTPAGDEWVECGGELIFAVDFTGWGFPIGLTESEMRRANEQGQRSAGWALAKRAFRRALEDLGESGDGVGYVKSLGEGLSYRVYFADCELSNGNARRLVARVPRTDAPPGLAEAARCEARLIAHLASVDMPVRLPAAVALVPLEVGLVVVQGFVHGLPVELRSDRGLRPWALVARAAAACHGVEAGPLRALLEGHVTRRDHARARLEVLDATRLSEGRDARAWAEEHLPPADPACLVHGDLLEQNLLLDLDDRSLGIVDWSEALLGDPAYDLAVVTRGLRKPFKLPDGLERLLEAYCALSPVRVTADEVRLHELCLVAGFYLQDVERHGPGSPAAENARLRLGKLLCQAEREA